MIFKEPKPNYTPVHEAHYEHGYIASVSLSNPDEMPLFPVIEIDGGLRYEALGSELVGLPPMRKLCPRWAYLSTIYVPKGWRGWCSRLVYLLHRGEMLTARFLVNHGLKHPANLEFQWRDLRLNLPVVYRTWHEDWRDGSRHLAINIHWPRRGVTGAHAKPSRIPGVQLVKAWWHALYYLFVGQRRRLHA